MAIQRTYIAVLAAIAVSAPVTAAHAIEFTRTFQFSASGFPAEAPTKTVSGTFEATYGPADPVTVDHFYLDIPVDSNIQAWYYAGAGGDQKDDDLQVGGIANAVNAVSSFTNDVDLAIFDTVGANPTGNLDYSTVNSAETFNASQVSISVVPEPAFWVLMILGVGAIGGPLRQRRGIAALRV